MAANLDLVRMHLHRQPNANTKLYLRSPLSTAINYPFLHHVVTVSLDKKLNKRNDYLCHISPSLRHVIVISSLCYIRCNTSPERLI